jgi:hypothetical protein
MGKQWGRADDISGARVPPTNEHSPSRAAILKKVGVERQADLIRILSSIPVAAR